MPLEIFAALVVSGLAEVANATPLVLVTVSEPALLIEASPETVLGSGSALL
ncbi:hypothetical protein [Bradyrhizobium brasilense]|uniref:hypothetical protein n=1 Tax=Bradyrhizobium brasilense TaxID=1419277 RepID=UPI0015A2E358|nr:hypothetical protein [Bradyrhizobium brasilense]